MRIGSIYPTYIYNTNYVSAKSLGRVNAIPNDALSGSKVGYAGSSSENVNPLRPGTSKDFASIFASQMAMSRMRAARIMKQPKEDTAAVQPGKVQTMQPREAQTPQPAKEALQNVSLMDDVAALGA